MFGEIVGRGHGHQPPVRSDPDRNHILLDALAQPNASVKTFLNYIAEGAVQDQLDGDVRIFT